MLSTLRKSLTRGLVAAALFAALSFAPHAHAAGAFVQSTSNNSSTPGALTAPATGSINVAAGHTLVVWVVTNNTGAQTVTTTACSLTYKNSSVSTNGAFLSLYYCQNTTAQAANTVSTTDGGAFAIYEAEYSGLSTTGGLAGAMVSFQQVGPGAAGANILTSDNGTSGQLNLTSTPSTVLAITVDMAGIQSATPNTGNMTAGTTLAWNSRTTGWTTGSAVNDATAEDIHTVATGNLTATFGLGGTNKRFTNFVTAAVAFPEAGGAGAALASAATDAISAAASLSTFPISFAPILLDDPGHSGGSDNLFVGSAPNDGTGDNARVGALKIKQWAADLNSMLAQLYPNRSVQTPTTGFTIAAAHGITQLILTPAGTLATGTVTFPPAPSDNQFFTLMSTKTITALTCNTSDSTTINGAPTTLTANTGVKFWFVTSLTTWVREQ